MNLSKSLPFIRKMHETYMNWHHIAEPSNNSKNNTIKKSKCPKIGHIATYKNRESNSYLKDNHTGFVSHSLTQGKSKKHASIQK